MAVATQVPTLQTRERSDRDGGGKEVVFCTVLHVLVFYNELNQFYILRCNYFSLARQKTETIMALSQPNTVEKINTAPFPTPVSKG